MSLAGKAGGGVGDEHVMADGVGNVSGLKIIGEVGRERRGELEVGVQADLFAPVGG